MREHPSLVENLVACAISENATKLKQFSTAALDNLGVGLNASSSQNPNISPPHKVLAELNHVDLFAESLHEQETCVTIRRTLLKIQGVISVSLDKNLGVITVATRGVSTFKVRPQWLI
jgi:hypothetical protein